MLKRNTKGAMISDLREYGCGLAVFKSGLAFALSLAICLGIAAPAAQAQSLKETACRIFWGKDKCGAMIAVVDAKACVITVRSKAFENLDPADAGCLIESVGTKRLFLRGQGRTVSVTRTPATIRIAGQGAVQVLTGHDKQGAEVWTPQNASAFGLNGDVSTTKRAIAHLRRDLCGATPAAVQSPSAERTMSAQTAFQRAARGEILLIDIRRQSEWRRTGIGKHAVPVTMHQDFKGFLSQVRALAARRGNRPIALICASGGRSYRMQRRLASHGFSAVIDVHEGMVGGFHGPGWINSGLPVRPYRPPAPETIIPLQERPPAN